MIILPQYPLKKTKVNHVKNNFIIFFFFIFYLPRCLLAISFCFDDSLTLLCGFAAEKILICTTKRELYIIIYLKTLPFILLFDFSCWHFSKRFLPFSLNWKIKFVVLFWFIFSIHFNEVMNCDVRARIILIANTKKKNK